jgi:hypothetical protein
VFFLTAKGLGNSEIAASLALSEATVKSHVGSILAKLRLKNRIQLVAFAYENGLLNQLPDNRPKPPGLHAQRRPATALPRPT